MKKVDEINSIMNQYFNSVDQIYQNRRNLELAKFISSKRIDSINAANEEIQQRNRDNKSRLNQEFVALEKRLEIRLKDLEERKENDIKEYINSDFIKYTNFYEGYIKNVRKRFEEEYAKKRDLIKEEFEHKKMDLYFKHVEYEEESLDPQSEIDHLNSLNTKLGFKNVDIRQITDLKFEAVKKLTLLKKEIEKEIQSSNLDADKEQLNKALDKINEYIGSLQLTKEENSVLMRSMTEKESVEYKMRNLRKELHEKSDEVRKNQSDEAIERIANNVKTIMSEKSKKDFTISGLEEKQEEDKPYYIAAKTSKNKSEKNLDDDIFLSDNDIISTKNRSSLLKLIYNKITNSISGLSAIKLDYYDNRNAKVSLRKTNQEGYVQQEGLLDLTNTSLELTEGEYLNNNQLINGLKNVVNNYEYTMFVTKEPKKEYILSPKKVAKLISKLEKITSINLNKVMFEKDSDEYNYSVYGKQNGKTKFISGKTYNVNIAGGSYISNDEFICELNKVITNKKLEKLKSVSKKLKSIFGHKKNRSKYHYLNYGYAENQIELDDIYVIKK